MLIVCTGTGTEVGKTWVGAAVLAHWRRRGVAIAARKPAQSFAPSEAGATDAEILANAAGADPAEVCPPHRWYPVPMAPPMAAASLGRPAFQLGDLVAELAWPAADVRWLETAGGPRSPLAADGDTVDLCEMLRPDAVVLVADAGLGTINAVRLAAAALSGHRIALILNRYDADNELHCRNRDWLAEFDLVVDPIELAERLLAS